MNETLNKHFEDYFNDFPERAERLECVGISDGQDLYEVFIEEDSMFGDPAIVQRTIDILGNETPTFVYNQALLYLYAEENAKDSTYDLLYADIPDNLILSFVEESQYCKKEAFSDNPLFDRWKEKYGKLHK